MENDALELCSAALERALQFPTRHGEYKGDIIEELERLKARLLSEKPLTHQDERSLSEIVLLTEKWMEA